MDDKLKDDKSKPEKPLQKKPSGKKKREGWACGFDILDEANWPRLKQLLIAHDEAAVQDITRYFKFMLREAESRAVHLIHMWVHNNPSLVRQVYEDCVHTIIEEYYKAIADKIKQLTGKMKRKVDFASFAHWKNSTAQLHRVRSMRAVYQQIKLIPKGEPENKHQTTKRLMSTEEPPDFEELTYILEGPPISESVYVEHLLSHLSPFSRMILELRYFADHTFNEVSSILRKSLPVIRAHLRSNINHLREIEIE